MGSPLYGGSARDMVDREAMATFITSFSGFAEDHQPSFNQIISCDETRLNFLLLRDKTLAASSEKSADGRKLSKKITINALAKVTGTIKLPLQVLGKSKHPR